MSEEFAVSIKDVHKDFLLPHQIQTTLKHKLMRRTTTSTPQRVLNGVSIEIPRGEFFGIVGRNGSGKSTLLKIIAGIYQPTSGSVEHRGSLVPLIELGVGFHGELSGRENVYLAGSMSGLSRKQVAEIYDEVVAFAGLDGFMDQKLKNYSSGMQVRLAFSIATHTKADILLLDEVLAVGDADFQRKCLAYFSDLKGSDTTVIFVSHSMDAVRKYCDRAVLLEDGQVRVAGSAEEVAEAYTRLFATIDYEEARKPGDRWGAGGVTIEHVEIAPTFSEIDDELVFTLDVRPDRVLDHRVRAEFLVRDRDGRQVFGTASVPAGDAKAFAFDLTAPRRLTWRVPNVLTDGEYSFTPIVISEHDDQVLEQWEFAGHFSVFREPHTAHAVAPPITLELS
jgi:ABC-2 type transport system ATP-binding protein